MSLMHAEPVRTVKPELLWLGEGAWVACDRTLPENDGRRVIAYLEYKDHIVYVLWVRNPRGVAEFPTLREALDAVEQSVPLE